MLNNAVNPIPDCIQEFITKLENSEVSIIGFEQMCNDLYENERIQVTAKIAFEKAGVSYEYLNFQDHRICDDPLEANKVFKNGKYQFVVTTI